MTADLPRRGMRSEIQALRAIAVVAVVLFHLWPTKLTGGFVGVDIFFVISGYLITSHLMREVAREGAVRLRKFWARRIRRLLPAAFVVLGFSLVATLVLMSWGEWKQGLREILASAFYVENWVLAVDSVDYLAAENSASLVQHYWSLSVEEQFYIIWPLLILGALWVARLLKTDQVGQRRAMLIALIVVFALSLATSVIWTHTSSASAYFATPTRAWEFAAGGLLAFLPTRLSAPAESRRGTRIHVVVGWAGLGAIAYAVIQYDGTVPFPSYTALLPVLGTVAVIWAGENASTWSHTLIGRSGPIQWLGDVSYSLYLWHWPLVVLYPLIQGHPIGIKGGLTLFVGMLVLAWLSKKFVEDPFRQGAWWKPSWRSYGFAVSGMAVLGIASVVSTIVIDGRLAAASVEQAPYASLRELQEEVDATLALSSWPIPDQLSGRDAQAEEWVVDQCIDVNSDSARERCVYGDVSSDRTLVVIGDSFATHLLPALRGAFGGSYKIVPLTLSQCPVVDVKVARSGLDSEFAECEAHNNRNWKLLKEMNPDVLIVSDATATTYRRMLSPTSGEERAEAYKEGVDEGYGHVKDMSVPVTYVIESPPNANCKPLSGLSRPSDCKSSKGSGVVAELVDYKIASARSRGIDVIDMRSWMCTEDGKCPLLVGNSLTRADGAHLSNDFAQRLSAVFAAEMKAINL